MPVRKKIAQRSRKAVSSRIVAAPENVPLIQARPLEKVFHFEHLFALSAAFIFVFSTLLAISTQSRAQEFRAMVSATVLPLDSYSNYRLAQMNPVQLWWSQLDSYHKFMYESAGGLAAVTIPLGALLYMQQRKIHAKALSALVHPTHA